MPSQWAIQQSFKFAFCRRQIVEEFCRSHFVRHCQHKSCAVGKAEEVLATVQNQILESFFEKLSKLATLEQTTLDELQKVLQSGKKLKADDFVALLTKNPKDGAASRPDGVSAR